MAYQHSSIYPHGNTWFNGVSETEQHHPHQTGSSPSVLPAYHLSNGELISNASLDVYRVPHDSTNSTSFYVPYQTTVADSDDDDDDDENDLEDDSDDDDDDEDATYQSSKRGGGGSKGTGQRRATRPNGSKRKRKRVLNGVQRAEATQREKRRMLKLNRAFEELRKVLPVTEFARNKLSRSETLKSAIDYINLMFDMLDAAKGHHPHHHQQQQHHHQHPPCL